MCGPRAREQAPPPLLCPQADSLEEVAAELERRGVPFVRQTVTEGGMQVGQLVRLVWVGGRNSGAGGTAGSSASWGGGQRRGGGQPAGQAAKFIG